MMSQHAVGAQRFMAALLALAAATQMPVTAGYSTSANSSPYSRSYSPHSRRYSPHAPYPASPPSEPPMEPPLEALTGVSPDVDSAAEGPAPDVSESPLQVTPQELYGQPALPASALRLTL